MSWTETELVDMKVGREYYILLRNRGRRQRLHFWGLEDTMLLVSYPSSIDSHWHLQVGDVRGIWKLTSHERSMIRYYAQHKITITDEEYNDLFVGQHGKCAICGKKGVKLHVDHKHGEKGPRGLLCTNCNTGIGCFKDDPELLGKAIDYLVVSLVV